MKMPAGEAEIRREVCARCPHPCEAYKSGAIDHADPAAACPVRWKAQWSVYGGLGLVQREPFTRAEEPVAASNGQIVVKARPLKEPTVTELATNFTQALARWVAAGCPVVDEATYATRMASCSACEYWHPKERGGLGKCAAPGCGCTKLKLWWATEHCPHPDGPKW